MKFTIEELLSRLPLPANAKWKDGVWDLEPFEKKGVRLVFFAPRGTDHQTAHDETRTMMLALPSSLRPRTTTPDLSLASSVSES